MKYIESSHSEKRFVPPFCPKNTCRFHSRKHHPEPWYYTNGTYYTKTFGIVQRYKCRHCKKGFSKQTFSIDYYAKMKIDYDRIIEHLVNSGSVRAISRVIRVRVSTISNRIYRLARQFIWIQSYILQTMDCTEDLVADGFESYTDSKYFPNNIHLLVGARSRFLYYFNHVNLRRKGRMTPKQHAKRAEIDAEWVPKPHSVKTSFKELVEWVVRMFSTTEKQSLTLFTDKKLEYVHAINDHPAAAALKLHGRLVHHRTDSRAVRTSSNPLAPVNIMDRQLRNDSANFRRKTICQTRDVNQGMARLFVLNAYLNLIKRFKVDNFPANWDSHGETAGIKNSLMLKLTDQIYKYRYFFSHNPLIEECHQRVWFMKELTPLKESSGYCPNHVSW